MNPHDNPKKLKVLFVCLGNICRSPAAEGVMKKLVADSGQQHLWEIDSAGTGDWHVGELPDRRMRAAGERRGYQFTHRCRQVTAEDFDRYDLIVGMDDNNIRNLHILATSRDYWDKIIPIGRWLTVFEGYSVPDPYYGTERDFDHVISLLEMACARMLADESLRTPPNG